jgi:hypothetical protein
MVMNITFKPFESSHHEASYRRIESPYDKEGKHSCVMVVEAGNLPKILNEWKGVNPRGVDLNSSVAREIRRTIDEEPKAFLYRNRGLVILAKSCSLNTKSKMVTIALDDKELHGLLDGGHTYAVIQQALCDVKEGWEDVYVNVQVLTGFNELEEVVDLAAARNTSQQVKDYSLDNMQGHFDMIKEVLSGQPYADKIAYMENDKGVDGEDKPVDIVRDILSCLVCFDIVHFTEDNHPLKVYNSKFQVLRHFEKSADRLKGLVRLLPGMLNLVDTINYHIPIAYTGDGGKWALLKGVQQEKNATPLYFTGGKCRFKNPKGSIYPVLAAFRQLVERRGEEFVWSGDRDPIETFHAHKLVLARKIGEKMRENPDSNSLGKDKSAWEVCYSALETAILKADKAKN